jgi:hypothetical protein
MAHTSANETLSPAHSSSSVNPHPNTPSPGSPQDAELKVRKKVVLYVQGHSERQEEAQGHMGTLLVLLLDDVSRATKDTVNALVRSASCWFFGGFWVFFLLLFLDFFLKIILYEYEETLTSNDCIELN